MVAMIERLSAWIADNGWTALALCAGTDEPDAWFPDGGLGRTSVLGTCRRCPVIRECGNAGQHERHGIWGGELRGRGRLRPKGTR